MRRLIGDRRGTTAVEFAVVAGAFVTLLVGGLQLGVMQSTAGGLQLTAALTARCAALGTCSAQSYAVSLGDSLAGPAAVKTSDVTVSTVGASACQGTSGGYSKFTMVTITSEQWSDMKIGSLPGLTVKATACYPSPT